MPFLRSGPASFSLISAEAFLLSGDVGITNCHCEEERRGNLVAVQSGLTSERLLLLNANLKHFRQTGLVLQKGNTLCATVIMVKPGFDVSPF